MNTDKTLRSKFIDRKDYPIWYYKELQPVKVDYVIWNLLKEPFVVEINGSKHEITFGKNRKSEIGQCIKYDDINNSGLCSYEVVEKGFKDGQWFTITDTDTTDEFKSDYIKRKNQYEKEKMTKWFKEVLSNMIKDNEDINLGQSDILLKQIENSSYEELENYMKISLTKANESI